LYINDKKSGKQQKWVDPWPQVQLHSSFQLQNPEQNKPHRLSDSGQRRPNSLRPSFSSKTPLIKLFENVVPRTAENFKRLLLGTANYRGRNLSLIGNHFHHVVPRAYAEIGHLEGGNCSIFGPTFRDESFELPHDRPGLLSCVSEENTNNSRFLITYAPCPFLDLKNVVFG
jgi:cyclophilin family peptidyl-prolyl cis-trans isomerase